MNPFEKFEAIVRLTPKLKVELAALAGLPDEKIDTSDIPEVTDWSNFALRGAFLVRGAGKCTYEEARWLDEMASLNGYFAPTAMGNGKWCVLSRFAYTCAIITGFMFDDFGYSNRWCFEGLGFAARALLEWESRDFDGEPIGWHRHPGSGRRRPDGDPAKEYSNL